jgi:luciferase family oxidoreductase group 1
LARTLQFGVLDQAPVPEGSTASTALANSVELAQHVEKLGFTRFWMSEHHAMQTLACSAPEIVLARIGAATHSIRLGSGGIMLPHYAPMKVAEVFRTLHAMYPDRIDLGVGRAPGGGPIETLALQRDRASASLRAGADDFPEQMAELLAWLGQNDGFPPGHKFGSIHLSPDMPGGPAVWVLGSSLWGAHAAAQWGLPYAFAHFFSPVATREALESYRRTFQPSRLLAEPRAVIAAGVIVAPTDEEAEYLHSSVRLLQRRIRQGDRRPVAAPDDALRELAQQQSGFPIAPAGAQEEGEFPRYFAGSPESVKRSLSTMATSLGLSEILINTITHSHQARLRSYTLLAEAFSD